jgi:DNA-binding NtrC family response regulator
MSLRGISVIIVEDSFAVARSLKKLLESYDCEVRGMAATADAALALIAHAPFDVAILDIQLAGSDVARVAARIREQGGRIIYVTGYDDLDMLPRELRSFPRLSKPVAPDLLVSTILEVVGHARGQRSD